MSAKPNQSIGDQLRTFAKLRRDAVGAPFEPHPATRKLLQDEVARTFSARTIARQTRPSNWLAAFWVRLSFAGGLVALFMIALIFWVPKEPEVKPRLTRNAGQSDADHRSASVPQPNSPAADAGVGNGGTQPADHLALNETQNGAQALRRYGLTPRGAAEAESLLAKSEAQTAPATQAVELQRAESQSLPKLAPQQGGFDAPFPPATSSGPARPALESKSIAAASSRIEPLAQSPESISKREQTTARAPLSEQDQVTADERRKAKEFALASTPANRGDAPSSFTANVPATNVFFFSQADARAKYRRNFNSPPSPPVLQSFQVEQTGSNVRIIDADGSIYEGTDAKQWMTSTQFGESKAKLSVKLAEVTIARTETGQPLQTSEIDSASSRISFRVSGTNQSLNRLVVVTGELQRNSNQQTGEQNLAVNTGSAPSQRVNLRGKLSIGAKVAIPIEASGTTR